MAILFTKLSVVNDVDMSPSETILKSILDFYQQQKFDVEKYIVSGWW